MANKPNKIVYGNQVLIDLTQDTVTVDKLQAGITAHDKSGEIITGTCTYDADTSDADAVASEILATKTAYVNGLKVTGTMANNGAQNSTISTKDQSVSILSGYHDGSGSVSIDSTEQEKLKPENIKDGVTILGVVGTHSGSESVKPQSKSVTPYTDKEQVVLPDAEFTHLSQVTVAKISYKETPNAQGGITVEIGDKSPA